ncbi:helix-turn-helix domain-containing protein [Paenibacillus sp. FSL R5-0475]|uniref:helix-turn-helix domain-containing protein n=1 Tax=Paenibacillus sp. FSL R5-0475 TaxID=2921643 RepID=UPI0030F9AB02
MANTLSAEQLIAIDWLAQPKKGGKTYEEIAELCGVTSRTLENWRKNAMFDAEFRRALRRNNDVRLPELLQSLADIAIRDGNAAMAKLALQVGGVLTESIEVTNKDGEGTDIEALRLRVASLTQRQSETSK